MATEYTPEKSSLSARVRTTLDDLAGIRKSLLAMSDQKMDPSGAHVQTLDLELAGELKSVVDALRLLLWAYIQALSAKSGREPEEVMNWYKMELAVEMLRSASKRPTPARSGSIADFERMVNHALNATAKIPVPDHTR